MNNLSLLESNKEYGIKNLNQDLLGGTKRIEFDASEATLEYEEAIINFREIAHEAADDGILNTNSELSNISDGEFKKNSEYTVLSSAFKIMQQQFGDQFSDKTFDEYLSTINLEAN